MLFTVIKGIETFKSTFIYFLRSFTYIKQKNCGFFFYIHFIKFNPSIFKLLKFNKNHIIIIIQLYGHSE